jgi:hypothetical protein
MPKAPTLAILAILNTALAGVVLIALYHPAATFDESPAAYGAPIGRAFAGLSHAVPTDSPATRYMLIFLNADSVARYSPRVAYLTALNQRVTNLRFKIVVVSRDGSAVVRKAAAGLPIYIDSDLAVHKALHISPTHSHGGVAVVANGAIEFRDLSILASDSLRQLAETFSLGNINYRQVPTRLNEVYGVGRTIPPSVVPKPLTKIAAGTTALRPGDQVILFIGSCAPCQLNEYVAELRALRQQLVTSNQEDKLEVLFDTTFDDGLLRAQLDSGHLPPKSYKADLRSIVASAYDTRTDELSVPWAMMMGPNRIVANAFPLRTY